MLFFFYLGAINSICDLNMLNLHVFKNSFRFIHDILQLQLKPEIFFVMHVKFIYSKKAMKFEKISRLILTLLFNYFFVHPKFCFWFLVTFGDEVKKILRNLCLHFARQDEQDGKNRKENHATCY